MEALDVEEVLLSCSQLRVEFDDDMDVRSSVSMKFTSDPVVLDGELGLKEFEYPFLR